MPWIHWCVRRETLLAERGSRGSECDEGDVVMFAPSHLDPSCRVLEPLHALARDPKEKCVAVIQPGGAEGMNQNNTCK